MKKTNSRSDDNLKRAALYIRVSTEEQAKHGVSLDAQKERLTAFAKENGMLIVDYYIDEGETARKALSKRKEYNRMMSDVQDGRIDVILFIKLDRWFRNVADYYTAQAILDKYNVKWIATEEEYDTTTANGRLHLNIKLAIAQDESDRTSERIKFVFANRVKEGKVISGKPSVGYKIEDKRWVIDEEKAQIVRDIYKTIIDNRTIASAQRYILEKYGVFHGLKEIKHIATNEKYLGKAHGIEGWCPQIIDKETFDKVQEIVSVRSQRNSHERTDTVYLFTGLIFCPECGHRLITYRNYQNTNHPYVFYRCPLHQQRRCSFHYSLNQTKIEDYLVSKIAVLADEYNQNIKKERQRAAKENTAEKDRAKILRKIEKLKDLYLEDLIPKETYEKDYAALSTALKVLDTEHPQISPITEKREIDLSLFKDFQTTYYALPTEKRKAFWSRLLRRIDVAAPGEYIIDFS